MRLLLAIRGTGITVVGVKRPWSDGASLSGTRLMMATRRAIASFGRARPPALRPQSKLPRSLKRSRSRIVPMPAGGNSGAARTDHLLVATPPENTVEIEGIHRGIADMKAGRVIPHDDAMSRLEAIINRVG